MMILVQQRGDHNSPLEVLGVEVEVEVEVLG